MQTYVDRTCEACGIGFKITLSRANVPGKGRFCSRPCAADGQKRETVTSRYKYVKFKSHPLLPAGGRLPEHRAVLYAKIGPGIHPCHWCSEPLSWEIQPPRKGSIVTDHLDDNGRNNNPGNLVPACHSCNILRTQNRKFKTQAFVVHGSTGRRRAAVERVCQRPGCGKVFLKEIALINQSDNRGVYCSRECVWNRNRPK